MNAAEPRLPTSLDADRLADALGRINRARRLSRENPDRLRALLDGFQVLLEIEPERRSDRDLDGGGALAELDMLLRESGAAAALPELQDLLEPIMDRLIEGLLAYPEQRLAAYGSLAPGGANHHHVSSLVGKWSKGMVSGTLRERGRGSGEGPPGLAWEAASAGVEVHLLESAALAGAWDRLDEFQGPGYQRILVPVETKGRTIVCNLYELAEATPGP